MLKSSPFSSRYPSRTLARRFCNIDVNCFSNLFEQASEC